MRTQKLLIFSLIILGLITSVISYTFFIKELSYETILETKAFNLDIDIKLGTLDLDPTSIYFDQIKKVYVINLYDTEAVNYINNLDINFIVEVSIASRLRFKIYESYELTRYYHNQEETILKEIVYINQVDPSHYQFSLLKKGIFDNYFISEGDYMYVDQMILPNQTYTFDLIEGGVNYPVRNNNLFYETCMLYLAFEVEVVQANRYQEVWNLQTDPFNP